MESIRKQFSLDWLPGSEENQKKEPSRLSKSSLEEAREFLYRSLIGSYLTKAQSHELKLHDLARSVKDDIEQFNFEEFWEVVKRLADRGFIELRDIQAPDGNYTVSLAQVSA